MSDVVIYNRWSQYRERLPIMNAEVAHFISIRSRDGGLPKGRLVIQNQLKIHNRPNTLLNEPGGTVSAGPGPTPKHIGRYHTEIFDCRAEVVRAPARDSLR